MAGEPLNDTEWNRFWALLAQPERSAEEYKELAALHDKAQDYIDDWKPDPKMVNAFLTATINGICNVLKRLIEILPAAGGMSASVSAIEASQANMAVALNGPANIPPMPPKPDASGIKEDDKPVPKPAAAPTAVAKQDDPAPKK